tara:strand:- start:321 stop:1613 length:1293 start_codon:yes stop_codon:yes gene_type:complete
MTNLKLKSILMMLLMCCAALAGCLDSDEETTEEETTEEVDETPAWLDASDAGYTYASNVDNHRSLMKDLCDIKSAASSDGGYNFTGAKDIYLNGKNAEKSDGSFRTLAGFAAATGKNHGYDTYYDMNGSVGAHILAAMEGTGDFNGTSDTVRYQGIAKLTANLGMVAYTIHELNSAVTKADAGNVDNDSGAPHNWDEGWAFFHGPDEDYGCSPAKVMEKRASDFGTADTDGVAATFTATEAAMVSGLAALQAEDAAGYNAAVDTVMKNVIITYSQAVLKYTYKMDSNTTAEKYQAEGYAFWKTMEAYAAPFMHDGCYNMAVGHKVMMMGEIDASACDAFIWTNGSQDANGTNDTCYNTVNHMVSTDATDEAGCDGYTSMYYQDNYAATLMNNVLDLTDATQLGTSYDVTAWLQPVWDHYGITSDDIGVYE